MVDVIHLKIHLFSYQVFKTQNKVQNLYKGVFLAKSKHSQYIETYNKVIRLTKIVIHVEKVMYLVRTQNFPKK